MKKTEVAIGIILNQANTHIFLTKRDAKSHQGNQWEFAGGKIEFNELPEQAMQRELHEEVGIEVTQASPFQVIEHDYGDKQLILHFFLVETYLGEPYGKEGQPGHWAAIAQLKDYSFPAANKAVIEALMTQF
ncbi:8-oxo-dGTP diphosphatase [Vibrio stylophorae]|uniref:8-oxo-dGTP diphosphatase n=1 Tax=Vibrio stylophorae TaxID=659351 RepID=A0ABN8DTR6_9VIBR|nr:8-oxo-dGTP diphosphatase MutT [Vibrio stylophorae]CAH0534441.1 8-oxo-dGTP diphosphatase [Vibrio stylophorae]